MINQWIAMMLLMVCLAPSGLLAEKAKVKIIVFDFGSVIVKTNKQQVSGFLVKSLRITPEQAAEALNLRKENTDGGMEENAFWLSYAQKNNIDIPEGWFAAFDQAKLEALDEIPGMIDLVKSLQRQGYQTALLSNVRGSQAAIKSKLGLYELFHPVLLSYEIGAKKPDPKAFEILLSRLKVEPKEVIFIDNKQRNVDAAGKLGIDGVVFTNAEQLKHDLKERGIEVSLSKHHSPGKPL